MEDKFKDKILKLALPITAQQFMLALVSVCDAVMLGGLNYGYEKKKRYAACLYFR